MAGSPIRWSGGVCRSVESDAGTGEVRVELASKVTGELVKVATAEDGPGHLADRDRLTPGVSLVKAAIEDNPGHLLPLDRFDLVGRDRAR